MSSDAGRDGSVSEDRCFRSFVRRLDPFVKSTPISRLFLRICISLLIPHENRYKMWMNDLVSTREVLDEKGIIGFMGAFIHLRILCLYKGPGGHRARRPRRGKLEGDRICRAT